ncbi:MAG: folate transporter [Clostridiales bacterium]|jgi:ECF transporter S component (folate family)|nr:folate transporter [Clostridiales bacterium]
MKNIRIVISLGMFIAMEVILTRFLSIQTPIVRISFSFIPMAISAMMFGPIFGGIAAALADIIGMMIFPTGGAFFPGFTLSAFLTGAIYGLFLSNKSKTIFRISMAVIVVSAFINLGLDTIWLLMITGKGILAILPPRIIKTIVMVPIQILLIKAVWNYIVGPLKGIYMYHTA